jgi:hypothetical protein
MYCYLQSEPGLWTVGFYDPRGQWHAESDHPSWEAASARCHYLNGGVRAQDDDREAIAEGDYRYYRPRSDA